MCKAPFGRLPSLTDLPPLISKRPARDGPQQVAPAFRSHVVVDFPNLRNDTEALLTDTHGVRGRFASQTKRFLEASALESRACGAEKTLLERGLPSVFSPLCRTLAPHEPPHSRSPIGTSIHGMGGFSESRTIGDPVHDRQSLCYENPARAGRPQPALQPSTPAIQVRACFPHPRKHLSPCAFKKRLDWVARPQSSAARSRAARIGSNAPLWITRLVDSSSSRMLALFALVMRIPLKKKRLRSI